MTDKLDDLYREIIMEHYHDPLGNEHLEDADIRNEGKNASCGDHIELEVKMFEDKIEKVALRCEGCAISVASGSMLTELVEGKSLEEVKRITARVKDLLKGEDLPDDLDLGDVEALQGVGQFPVRIKCALLAWSTLENGIREWENGRKSMLFSGKDKNSEE